MSGWTWRIVWMILWLQHWVFSVVDSGTRSDNQNWHKHCYWTSVRVMWPLDLTNHTPHAELKLFFCDVSVIRERRCKIVLFLPHSFYYNIFRMLWCFLQVLFVLIVFFCLFVSLKSKHFVMYKKRKWSVSHEPIPVFVCWIVHNYITVMIYISVDGEIE